VTSACSVLLYIEWFGLSYEIFDSAAAVNKAWKILDEPDENKKCKEVVDEAEERVKEMVGPKTS